MERVIELNPWWVYGRPLIAMVSRPEVGGVAFNGQGNISVEELWVAGDAG
jgi:hypothetical protein